MRQPTHLRITWQDDNTLKVEADYGSQTRLLHFGPPPDPGRLDSQNAIIGGLVEEQEIAPALEHHREVEAVPLAAQEVAHALC